LWRSPEEACERILATLPYADLLKVNEIELALLTGSQDLDAASRSLLEQDLDLCVVTLGPDGSFFQVAEGGEYIPPFKVQAVDATGCGDAFVAGLLCQLIVGRDWRAQLSRARMREILRYANAVGALTALTQGVIPALPSAAQVADFLAQYSQSTDSNSQGELNA
jgi:sugar/nucleoside kinase (ribokinase family)